MNGMKFKREIERIFRVARERVPHVTNDTLDSNGAIYYMNGNDGTDFDWSANDRLCEFYIYHENEIGFIKAFVNRDDTVDVYIYEHDTDMSPTHKFTENLTSVNARDFCNLMYEIADHKYIYDEPIDNLNWNIDTGECLDIASEHEEDDDWDWE